MKYAEFHKKVKRNGWVYLRAGKGSHFIYEKNGLSISVPFHGAKEMGNGLEKMLTKEMGLK